MGFITVGDENTTPIELYYEDQGAGQPSSSSMAIRSTATAGSARRASCSPRDTGHHL